MRDPPTPSNQRPRSIALRALAKFAPCTSPEASPVTMRIRGMVTTVRRAASGVRSDETLRLNHVLLPTPHPLRLTPHGVQCVAARTYRSHLAPGEPESAPLRRPRRRLREACRRPLHARRLPVAV